MAIMTTAAMRRHRQEIWFTHQEPEPVSGAHKVVVLPLVTAAQNISDVVPKELGFRLDVAPLGEHNVH